MEDGALMVSTSDSHWSGQGPFPRRGFANLLSNYFNGYNEGIIGREAEMRGFMVK